MNELMSFLAPLYTQGREPKENAPKRAPIQQIRLLCPNPNPPDTFPDSLKDTHSKVTASWALVKIDVLGPGGTLVFGK